MNYRDPEKFPVSPEEREMLVHGRQVTMHEIPVSMQRDWQIRTMVERAVRYDEAQVSLITKELQEQGLQPLRGAEVTVVHPFKLPSVKDFGSNNETLRRFCFDTYDALAQHFTTGEWNDWFIAPYFREGDDMRMSCELGVFVTDIAETVVK